MTSTCDLIYRHVAALRFALSSPITLENRRAQSEDLPVITTVTGFLRFDDSGAIHEGDFRTWCSNSISSVRATAI